MNAPAAPASPPASRRGQWMALAAAFLGWMFDGFEMGLFPLVSRPALMELLEKVGKDSDDWKFWNSVITAAFLIGAATGGVLFGWLGDRIGRVRSMTLSVLTYTLFMGLCGFARSPNEIFVFRFVAALGMGGEWSLGVSLVMELWPNRSRGVLAGLIGAASNVGFLLIALIGLSLGVALETLRGWLTSMGTSEATMTYLMGQDNSAWRLLMMIGAVPALLTFFIRLFVPESQKWLHAKEQGATSAWATRDLIAVLIGTLGPIGMVYIWVEPFPLWMRVAGTVAGTLVALVGYSYPVAKYLQRSAHTVTDPSHGYGPTMRRMLLAACLSGVALLGTWASFQNAVPWVSDLANKDAARENMTAVQAATYQSSARAMTQILAAIGAILGTMAGALLGDKLGRRSAYFVLCLLSLASSLWFFLSNTSYTNNVLISVFVGGATTASFYGWLPLYLPELFRTSVRATGQGFAFNFGRVIAAVGAIQVGNLIRLFKDDLTIGGFTIHAGFPMACTAMSMIYVVGMIIIWFAPETRGKPLPE
ncbi:MAG: MFS transporter [Planctomycetaceae bacterium]|nr:MFS transporter [Planctomycetaceae bacterium]